MLGGARGNLVPDFLDHFQNGPPQSDSLRTIHHSLNCLSQVPQKLLINLNFKIFYFLQIQFQGLQCSLFVSSSMQAEQLVEVLQNADFNLVRCKPFKVLYDQP